MNTKSKLSLSLLLFCAVFLMSATSPILTNIKTKEKGIFQNENFLIFKQDLPQLTLEQLLTLTPKKYKEITGKKLGFKKTIQLKIVQKKLKKLLKEDSPDKTNMSKGGYIILAIFGLSFIGIGVVTDWKGNDWWINLLLSLLCWLPGFIHAMVKMKNYNFN